MTDRVHIMRLAVQDLLESSVRGRAIRTRNRDLFSLYMLLLVHLHEQGGELPADPAALADKVVLFSPEEIATMLPELDAIARQPGKRGGILVQDGVIRNTRVDQELSSEREFRETQGAHASRRWNARRSMGSQRLPTGQPQGDEREPVPTQCPPAPAPAPAPTAAAAAAGDCVSREPVPTQSQPSVPHDASDTQQLDMALRLDAAARLLSPPVSAQALLARLSRTPRGKVITDLRDASPRWLRRTFVSLYELELQLLNSGVHLAHMDPASHGPPASVPEPEQEAANQWGMVLACLERAINRDSFSTWFRPTHGQRLAGDVLLVRVPNALFVEWLRRNYADAVAEAVQQAGLTFRVEFFAAVEFAS